MAEPPQIMEVVVLVTMVFILEFESPRKLKRVVPAATVAIELMRNGVVHDLGHHKVTSTKQALLQRY